jgi:hypothetical protein|tara:strand:+ start:725 stop:922 length:198 start_codon:yes stop_codon:yes gene_type:complete
LIKKGDKVSLIRDMSKVGVVVDLIPQKSKVWLVGGAAGFSHRAMVMLDKDGQVFECRIEDLMRLE